MAACRGCGVELPGRQQKCEACKGVTGKRRSPSPRPRAIRKRPAPAPAPVKTADRPRTGKAVAKKTPAPPRKRAARRARPTGVLASLKPRGLQLWEQIGVELDSPAGTIALEASRAVDRLDELDKVITGRGVLQLLMFKVKSDLEDLVADPGVVEVKVRIEMAGILSETRQQQSNLAGLLSALGVSKAGARPPAPTPTQPTQPVSRLDEMRARRQQK